MRAVGVPGLPDTQFELQPVTALLGPRGSGKSRLLAAISWLVSGSPSLVTADDPADVRVEAIIDDGSGRRTIVRDRSHRPVAPLPHSTFLAARERVVGVRPDAADRVEPSPAEAAIAAIEERIAEGESDALLIIEEPELDLNPQPQRYLYRVLRHFAERNQVIYSTRSPSFVDAVYHAEIVRLDVSGSDLAIRRAPRELMSDDERLRLAAEFNHERGEMFFANAVVLVEGQTEAQTLPTIFRSLGRDPDALGIAITEVGGKGNLVLAARILAELHIPHMLVYDSDRGRPGSQMNAGIAAAVGDTAQVRLDPDFEAAAGIHAHDDKVLHAWRRFANAAPERIPEPFHRIVEIATGLAAGTNR